MNINRNNYEEFFLLYVDNELSAAGRNAVELFVHDNADLKAELSMLQQTVISADAIHFEHKNNLLKEDISALQQNLLLYIDNELSAAEKINIEKSIKAEAVAQRELSVLQQTKLQADTAIVFANKKILYRKEAGKVIGLSWKRIAAAAVLLGFGGWLTLSLIKTGKHEIVDLAKNNGTKNITVTPVQNITPVVKETITTQDKKIVTRNGDDTNPAIAAVKHATQKNELPVTNKSQPQYTAVQKEAVIAIVQQNEIKKPSKDLPEPGYKNFNNPDRNLTARIDVTPKNAAIDNAQSGSKIIDADLTKKSGDIEGYALNSSFTEGGTDQDEEHKKSKLGGFFRKVKRIVERNTNVQSGNGVKIAGFDIAIK